MTTPVIPKTARAAVLSALNTEYAIDPAHPVKQPADLAPGECLIRLEYSGVCHSDLHIMKGDWARKAALPLVGGHEGVGRVVAVAAHTPPEGADVKVGDRVGIKWIADVCLRCEMCRKGNESSCSVSFQRSHGFQLQGTFAEYIVSYLKYVTPIPEEIDSASATPILCAGMTVYKALKQANVGTGNWVSISGAGGGLGHLAVQYAVAMGLRVCAIDTGAAKKALALSLGAESWVDFRESGDNLVRDVQAATGGLGPQGAVVAAGDPRPFKQALMYLRATGTLVAVGMPAGSALLNVPIPLLIAKSLTIVGSAIGNRQDVAEALQIAAHGRVKCRYEVRELEDLNAIFKDLEEGTVAGRVVIRL